MAMQDSLQLWDIEDLKAARNACKTRIDVPAGHKQKIAIASRVKQQGYAAYHNKTLPECHACGLSYPQTTHVSLHVCFLGKGARTRHAG